ncbi:MAG: hypothetical protein HY537_04745 [Deltaproteobacteria bacterium]|nr:hypothetical protein [Deltaproteobacteria bacterium]
MKLSISLPEYVAKEIKGLAKETERSISWWIQRAWVVARDQLRNPAEYQKAKKAALAKLEGLEGALKEDFPKTSSVELAHSSFKKKK